MKSNARKKLKKRLLFNPDEISTQISQAINSDLGAITQSTMDPNDPLAYARYRQCSEVLKKYCSPSQDKDRLEAEAFAKFREVNQHIGIINDWLELTLPWSQKAIQKRFPEMWKIHLRARAIARYVLTPLDEDEWFEECQHSSGSSIGVPYRDTSLEAKFTYPLSTTEGCLLYWDRYRRFNPFLDLEVETFNLRNPVTGAVKISTGSRATTVDKTTDKRRFIAVEPTLNMFFQQGLMEAMYKRLHSVGLDVESLPNKHKKWAREGSITGKHATVDWSSASDCVSIVLLKWLLPPKWYGRVVGTRSPLISLQGSDVCPNMISTMGNAVTFPLETLVFWSYAHAVRFTLRNPHTNTCLPQSLIEDVPGEVVSVFGDDCVIPSWMAAEYVATMESIGFLLNVEKSFYGSERFRESCGGDYLVGFDVRPYNIKAPHSTALSSLEPWLYIMMNRIQTKYLMCFGPLTYVYDKAVWRVFEQLFLRFNLKLKIVPDFLPDDAGAKLSSDCERFFACYSGFKLNPISRSHHGTYSFNYCRFVYWDNLQRDDGLRYMEWLRKPTVNLRKKVGFMDDEYSTKRKGGYVVARGCASNWTLPVLQAGAR